MLLILLVFAVAAHGTCVGDCNSDGGVTVEEIIAMVGIALGMQALSNCPNGDADSNGEISIDEILQAVNNSLSACAPPSGTAQLHVIVTNPSGTGRTACVSGTLVDGPVMAASAYGCPPPPDPTPVSGCTSRCQSVPAGQTRTFTISGLCPGEWLHRMHVSATSQRQYRRSAVVADPAKAAEIGWKVAGSVLTVNTPGDGPSTPANCPGSSCRFRDALAKANNGIAGPVLIDFSSTLAEVQLTENTELTIQSAAQNLLIDGTHPEGHPNPLEPFHTRSFRAQLHQNPNDKTVASASTIRVRAEGVELVALQIRRSLGTPVSGQDLDVLAFSATSKNGRVKTCRLDGGAQGQSSAGSGAPQGKDCIDAGNTGAVGFSDTVAVENSELRYCWDRGMKISPGYAVIRDSWIHNNLRGGIFALNPGASNLKSERNLIEYNGWNCPNGASRPEDCDGTLVRAEALQASADDGLSGGPFNFLQMQGDIARNGGSNGIEIKNYSSGTITDVFACGMIISNLDATTEAGKPGQTIVVRGTATSLAQGASGYGTFLFQSGSSRADIDLGSSSAGRNAFVANPTKNLFNGSGNLALMAMGNQWQLCGNGSSCNEGVIENPFGIDTNGAVDVTTAEPHRAPLQFQIDTDGVYPRAVSRVGAVVHITGRGFNAIEGYTNPGGPGGATSCTTLMAGNTCSPSVRGTCVEFFDHATNGWVQANDVLGVTPTHLVVESPIACSRPTTVRVTRLGPEPMPTPVVAPPGAAGDDPPPPGTYNFCKN